MRKLWIIILSLLFPIVVYTQSDSPVVAEFVKPNSVLKSNNNIYFNSIRIINTRNFPTTIRPTINLPKDWKFARFLPIPKSVEIPANDTIYIPFKAQVPSKTKGDKNYKIEAIINDTNHKPLTTIQSELFIPKLKDWKLEIIDEDVLLHRDSSRITFKARVKNEGNTNESIKIVYKVQDAFASQRVDLSPGVDSVIEFNVNYEERINYGGSRKEYIGIAASDGHDIQEGSVYFTKFKNDYHGIRSRRRTNTWSLISDHIPTRNFNTIGLRAIGSVLFKNDDEFTYFISNNNLLNRAQLERSSIYRMSYYSQYLDIGLGSTFDENYLRHRITTMGGRNTTINGLNTLNFTLRALKTDKHLTTLFLSRNIRMPVTSLSASHRLSLNQASLLGAYNYTLDFFGKKSTEVGTFHGRTPIGKHQYLDVLVNGAKEIHHLESIGNSSVNQSYDDPNNRFSNKSFNYRLFYSLYLKGLDIAVNSGYASVRYPNTERGVFNMETRLRYHFKNNHNILLSYRKQTKAPNTYQDNFLLPILSYSRENYFLQYDMPIGTTVQLQGGALIQNYTVERPLAITGELSPFGSGAYKVYVGTRTRFKRNYFRAMFLYGVNRVDDFMDSNGTMFTDIKDIPTTDIQLEYGFRNSRIGLNYLIGPNSTVGQFQADPLDFYEHRIRLNSYVEQYFFKELLRLSFSGSSFYRMQQQRGTFSAVPRIDVMFRDGWQLSASSMYNISFFKLAKRWMTQDFSRFQFGVTKSFHVSLAEKYHNLDVICFRDDNGNGQMEAHEFGLPDVRLELKPIVNPKKASKKIKKQPVTLFSNHKGKMYFKKIPEGIHKINIHQIHNNELGYIPSNNAMQELKIEQDMIVYIPFAKANYIKGKAIFERAKLSRKKISLANIRVTVINDLGEEFSVLTDEKGLFKIPVPKSRSYTVKINNPFDKSIKLEQTEYKLKFEASQSFEVNFKFIEKRRKINFN